MLFFSSGKNPTLFMLVEHVRLLKVFYKFTAALTWLMYKVIIPSNHFGNNG